jgi:hypothetical protein
MTCSNPTIRAAWILLSSPKELPMNGLEWVRELSRDERPLVHHAKTGDRLPDGSILLLQEDMDRMGLNALRDWIVRKVVQENATITVGSGTGLHRQELVLDEIA